MGKKVRKLLVAAFVMTAAGVFAQRNAAPEGFVRVEGGTFTMGSPATEPGRYNGEVQHQVTVSSFYLGRYEVTLKEYEEVMGPHPFFGWDHHPVEQVNWYDAIEYCNKRSEREGLAPAYTIDKSRRDPNDWNDDDDVQWVVTWNRNANGYRLPTEAEWKYACRAGTTTPFSTGNNITTRQANYDGIPPYDDPPYNDVNGTYREETTAAGHFAPNSWGLYDMHGNVQEWCWDRYGSYAGGAQTNPQGAVSGSERVIRGGSWYNLGHYIRSAFREGLHPSNRNNETGFRVARKE